MATTYLELTNMLLRELNEVALTSGGFHQAIGIQQHVKDSVNKAYFDIVIDEPKWPFLSVGQFGTGKDMAENFAFVLKDVEPMYGNYFIETVAGQRWYDLKENNTNIHDAFSAVDWENFYLTTVGVTGEETPFTGKNLRYSSIESWKDFRREDENLDRANTNTYGEPDTVIKHPNFTEFGLSPIPDKAYRVYFHAYVQPRKLDSHNDTVLIPDLYTNVLLAKARYYIWQFKDNPQAASFALDDYRNSFRQMRSNLMENQPLYLKDDRMRFV